MYSFTQFKNRVSAGKQLAGALIKYKENPEAVIYALPRGGVVTAFEVVSLLHVPLDIVIVRKIGHPYSPEYAIGSITEHGIASFDAHEIEHIDPVWLKQAMKAAMKEAKRRRKQYLGLSNHISPKGKIAILIDDGVATGFTIKMAIAELKRHSPKKIIVAVPVMPEAVYTDLEDDVDECISLIKKRGYFGSISQYYEKFPEVTDEEVISLLNYKPLFSHH